MPVYHLLQIHFVAMTEKNVEFEMIDTKKYFTPYVEIHKLIT